MPRTSFITRLLDRGEKVDRRLLEDFLLDVTRERDLLRVLFDSMIEGILAFTENQELFFLNQAAQLLLSISEAEVLGKKLEQINFPEDFSQIVSHCLKNETRLINYQLIIKSPHLRVLNLNIIPVIDNEKQYTGTLVLFFDITEQKEKERQLQHTEKLASLTTVAAGIAHEIRNPLNSLYIHIQLLERTINSELNLPLPDLEDNINIVKEEIARLNNVIEKFLGSVRPLKLQLEPKDLNQLMCQVLDLLEPEINQNKIHLIYHQPASPAIALIDENQLQQAFINIIKNSLQAMPDGGKLEITMQVKTTSIEIIFCDNGLGIAEENLEHIFEPYFTTRPEGSGLGLMQVERAINKHQGNLSIESKEGVGTQLFLSLPLWTKGPKLLDMKPKNKTNQKDKEK